jgi:ubiquinone/menaquinone biosynthesis C-methylase UbiE
LRLFSQNQAVLTIIQSKVDIPETDTFEWLDLACGKGQLISQLDSNFNEKLRQRIIYYGYDVDKGSISEANQIARDMKFQGYKFDIGEIEKFDDIIDKKQQYDFITLTNSIHEFNPRHLPTILFCMILRLKDTGSLFIYDMEKLPKKELGAITWTKEEFSEVINILIDSIDSGGYHPFVGQWLHSSCSAWNVFIQKKYINCKHEDLLSKKNTIISIVGKKVKELLDRKYKTCQRTLETYTECGADNQDEEKNLLDSLYDFWALSNIKEE